MKRVSLLCAVAAAAALMVPPAKADELTISFNGGPVGVFGTGVFDATNNGGGLYTITGVESGSVADPFTGASSIVSLSTFAYADNLLSYPSTTFFDDDGLSFLLANGQDINLFYDGSNLGEVRSDGQAELITATVTPTIAVTPEPSSFILVGSAALLGMGMVLRQRRSLANSMPF